MKNFEVIDKSEIVNCFRCSGKGIEDNKKCSLCNGTGKWREPNYYLIYTDKNGVKQAFQSDFVK